MDDSHPGRRGVSTLERGFLLLDAFRDGGGPLGNGDLAARTGLPKPTISRLAGALVEAGYLEYLPRIRQYQLGLGVISLGRAKLRSMDVRRAARAPMTLLAGELGITVDLGTPVDGDVMYLDFVRGERPAAFHPDIGGRNPLDVTAAGRACLAAMIAAERQRAFAVLAARRGAEWPAIQGRIEASLAEMRRLGFCVVEREFRPENAFAAVALRDRRADRVFSFSGGMIGDSASHARDLLYTRIGPRLMELAAVVGEELGA